MKIYNKKGAGYEISEFPLIILILILLVIFLVVISMGSVNSGKIESSINARDNVNAYTYYPDLVNFLNTNTSSGDRILDLFKGYLSNGGNKEVLDDEIKNFLNSISSCYYDGDSVKKVGFILYLSNGDKWDNIPKYKEWKILKAGSTLVVLPSQLTGSTAYQRITEDNYIYLYREDGINVDLKECDNLE